MILGIGSDLIHIRRIEQTIARHGDRFLRRVFTDVEIEKGAKRAHIPSPSRGGLGRGAFRNPAASILAAHYAKRFAAKEACSKALGTGLKRGVYWRDMGVVNAPSGQPTMELTGGALQRLRALTPPGMTARLHLTITDDFPLAQAFVVVEAGYE